MGFWTLIAAICAVLVTTAAAVDKESPVTEIHLQRVPGLGVGPADRLVLKADGTALYTGVSRVERVGEYRGSISQKSFARLVKQLRSAKFFELDASYRGTIPGTRRPVLDAPGIIVSAVCDGKTKTVADYGYGGPEALQALQHAILDILKTHSWRKKEPESSRPAG